MQEIYSNGNVHLWETLRDAAELNAPYFNVQLNSTCKLLCYRNVCVIATNFGLQYIL